MLAVGRDSSSSKGGMWDRSQAQLQHKNSSKTDASNEHSSQFR